MEEREFSRNYKYPYKETKRGQKVTLKRKHESQEIGFSRLGPVNVAVDVQKVLRNGYLKQ